MSIQPALFEIAIPCGIDDETGLIVEAVTEGEDSAMKADRTAMSGGTVEFVYPDEETLAE